MTLTNDIIQYIDSYAEEAFRLLCELAPIPAPSNHEERRAQFCLDWLRSKGAEGAYIDEALNVIYPIADTGENELMVFMAHSDVVFPDTDPLPLKIENGRIYCPGVGDDTANAVALLAVAGYLAEKKLTPKDCGVLLVVNSGEEGLGNLKGSKQIMADFGSRVKEFITFDGNATAIVTKAVGSRRYRVTVTTEGGHSYGKFGAPNAIAQLAQLITRLYQVQVPALGKTTYNVGTISGGTSVNTIAQEASMLYEFRSDEREGLAFMQAQFDAIVEEFRSNGVQIETEVVGDRPCGLDVDNSLLAQRAAKAVERHYGLSPALTSGSTDCNVPLSMGIPAICPGCVLGAGAHTREEYVEIDSLLPGLKVAFELVLHHF
jgi:acetylornithine deacetylase/succinyl-diaminopimelate desuccinylase-like protein